MSRYVLFLFLILIISWMGNSYGNSVGEGGASVFTGFDVGVGGRGRALGDAYTAVADNVESLYWNVAGLADLKKPQIYLAYHKFVADILHQYISYGQNIGNNSIGVSFYVIDYGSIERTEESSSGLCIPKGNYSAKESCTEVGYARYISERISIGGKIKLFYQRIDNSKEKVVAGDLGGLYKIKDNLKVALVINNISSAVGQDRLSNIYKLGLAYAYKHKSYLGLILPTDIIIYSDKSRIRVNLGAELKIYNILFLRVGYKLGGLNIRDKYSIGGGISVGKHLQVDFVYLPYSKIEQKMWNYSVLLKF